LGRGRPTGEFNALDANSGELLWQFQCGSGHHSSPMTYSVDGRQYIAVPTGWGAWTEGFLPGMLGAGQGSSLFVFALPEGDYVPSKAKSGTRHADDSVPPRSTGREDRSATPASAASLLPDLVLSAEQQLAVRDLLNSAGELWEAETSRTWLVSPNGYLNGARPVDVLLARGPDEVRDALEAALSGAYA